MQINGILDDFFHALRQASLYQWIADADILEVVFVIDLKESFAMNIITANAVNDESIAQVVKIINYNFGRRVNALAFEVVDNICCREGFAYIVANKTYQIFQ